MTLKTTYPLLTAWLNNELRAAWNTEREALRQQDPKLLVSVAGLEAAARLSAHITQEMERLSTDCHHLRLQHRFDQPTHTNEVIEFHNDLRNGSLRSYRDILSDISGNQHVWAEEERYLESIHYEDASQIESYSSPVTEEVWK